MAELVVQAAKHASGGKRLIVLCEGRGKTERGKGIGIEDFGEPAAGVAMPRWLQDFYIAQGGITKGHVTRIGQSAVGARGEGRAIPILVLRRKNQSSVCGFSYRNLLIRAIHCLGNQPLRLLALRFLREIDGSGR